MSITYRSAVDHDWPRVFDLLVACDLPVAGAREHLSQFILCEEFGALRGCAGAEIYRDDALLRSVAVSAPQRGRGLGVALVERMVAQLAARNVKTVGLLTTTAAPLFERMGFVRVERGAMPSALQASEEFRGACPGSAAAMLKRL